VIVGWRAANLGDMYEDEPNAPGTHHYLTFGESSTRLPSNLCEQNTLCHRWMPVRGGDNYALEPPPSRRWSILITFEKLTN
jgi:hypothetical protein